MSKTFGIERGFFSTKGSGGNEMHVTSCPVCLGANIINILDIPQVPVHCNLLWRDQEAARNAPRADIQLSFCASCGHLFNQKFEPNRTAYGESYENTLDFSPRFSDYSATLARYLVDQYDLNEKEIMEIGSGQGDFLRLICKLGHNHGIGFDPSYVPHGNAREGPEFIREFYGDRHRSYSADFIIARHILEHLDSPREFLSLIRSAIGDRKHARVYVEVPNILYTLRDLGIWDLIFEHPSYFNATSIRYLFEFCGFEILAVKERFKNQFLGVEARPATATEHAPKVDDDSLAMLRDYVEHFARHHVEKIESWHRKFDSLGRKVVVWGAGSKGVTFLNTFSDVAAIEYAIDINPRKAGMFIAGTGQEIVPPKFLQGYRPETIIVMNTNYMAEINQMVQDLDLAPDFLLA